MHKFLTKKENNIKIPCGVLDLGAHLYFNSTLLKL